MDYYFDIFIDALIGIVTVAACGAALVGGFYAITLLPPTAIYLIALAFSILMVVWCLYQAASPYHNDDRRSARTRLSNMGIDDFIGVMFATAVALATMAFAPKVFGWSFDNIPLIGHPEIAVFYGRIAYISFATFLLAVIMGVLGEMIEDAERGLVSFPSILSILLATISTPLMVVFGFLAILMAFAPA